VGVHLTEAIIAYMADEPWQPALRRMLGVLDPGADHLDVTTGRAGQLLACAHALAVLPRDGTAGLRDGGDAALDALWERDWRLADEVPGCGAAYLAIIYLPPLQHLLGTAALPPQLLLITVPFPFIVWGADEIRRYLLRRHDSRRQAGGPVGGRPESGGTTVRSRVPRPRRPIPRGQWS
jgi:hypothetical protein